MGRQQRQASSGCGSQACCVHCAAGAAGHRAAACLHRCLALPAPYTPPTAHHLLFPPRCACSWSSGAGLRRPILGRGPPRKATFMLPSTLPPRWARPRSSSAATTAGPSRRPPATSTAVSEGVRYRSGHGCAVPLVAPGPASPSTLCRQGSKNCASDLMSVHEGRGKAAWLPPWRCMRRFRDLPLPVRWALLHRTLQAMASPGGAPPMASPRCAWTAATRALCTMQQQRLGALLWSSRCGAPPCS